MGGSGGAGASRELHSDFYGVERVTDEGLHHAGTASGWVFSWLEAILLREYEDVCGCLPMRFVAAEGGFLPLFAAFEAILG